MKRKIQFPQKRDFIRGYKAFDKHETRDAIYEVSRFLLTHFWGKPRKMSEALGVLLLVWNNAFYRYGRFSWIKLEKCIAKNMGALKELKRKDIFSLSKDDERIIKKLFSDFLKALVIDVNGEIRTSPVGTVKALALLVPDLFPFWDNKIANAYGCRFSKNPGERYIEFMWICKEFAERIRGYGIKEKILKLLDQYNYMKITKNMGEK
jgi:hypothetical protein